MSIGYIYCFSNPSMPGLYKVGMTDRTPEERAKELYSTGVPEPFVIKFAIKVQDPKHAESIVHKALESFTVRPNPKREYFRASIEQIKLVFDLININQIKEEKEIVSDNESVCTVISDLTTEADETSVKTCEKSVKTCEKSVDNNSLYQKYLKIGQRIGVSNKLDGTWGEWDGTQIIYENKGYTPSGFSKKLTNTHNKIFVMVDNKITSWATYKKYNKSV